MALSTKLAVPRISPESIESFFLLFVSRASAFSTASLGKGLSLDQGKRRRRASEGPRCCTKKPEVGPFVGAFVGPFVRPFVRPFGGHSLDRSLGRSFGLGGSVRGAVRWGLRGRILAWGSPTDGPMNGLPETDRRTNKCSNSISALAAHVHWRNCQMQKKCFASKSSGTAQRAFLCIVWSGALLWGRIR